MSYESREDAAFPAEKFETDEAVVEMTRPLDSC